HPQTHFHLWDRATGDELPLPLDYPQEIAKQWYQDGFGFSPDGSALVGSRVTLDLRAGYWTANERVFSRLAFGPTGSVTVEDSARVLHVRDTAALPGDAAER